MSSRHYRCFGSHSLSDWRLGKAGFLMCGYGQDRGTEHRSLPSRQNLPKYGVGILALIYGHTSAPKPTAVWLSGLITLHRLDKAFRNTVTLRTSDRGRSGLQSWHFCEAPGFTCTIGRTVIRQPFNGRYRQVLTEPAFNRTQHYVLYRIAVITAGAGSPV